MHGLQHQVLVPFLVLHPLPHLGCHIVEADVEGWDGRGLVERGGAEGEPQSAALDFLQSAYGCLRENVCCGRRLVGLLRSGWAGGSGVRGVL